MSRSTEQKHHKDKCFPSKNEQQIQAWWENIDINGDIKGQQLIIDQSIKSINP